MTAHPELRIELCRGATIALHVDQANSRIYFWLDSRGTEASAALSPGNAREVARNLIEFAHRAEAR